MKYALVTGGSRGIGRNICVNLAEMGNHILINYNTNKTEAEKTLKLVEEAGSSGELLPFDVSNPEETESILEAWINDNEDKQIEILVNNAGIHKDNLLVWMTSKEWHDVISTNLDSTFYITRKIIKGMLVKRSGRIINVVSLSGQSGLPGQVNYSAAKAGVIAFTKSLAQEVAKRNITVNAVAPGIIETDMTKDLSLKNFKNLIPMKRFGKPEEISNVVAFLASDKATYITGEVISVNGGMYT